MRTAVLHRLFYGSEWKYQVSYIWNRAELIVKLADEDERPNWV